MLYLHETFKEGTMARPKKNLDTPELRAVAEAKAKLDESLEVAAADRATYEQRVVKALETEGYRTLAAVAEVSTSSIRDITIKHEVTSPRAK